MVILELAWGRVAGTGVCCELLSPVSALSSSCLMETKFQTFYYSVVLVRVNVLRRVISLHSQNRLQRKYG